MNIILTRRMINNGLRINKRRMVQVKFEKLPI
jgi:hypothetical protein